MDYRRSTRVPLKRCMQNSKLCKSRGPIFHHHPEHENVSRLFLPKHRRRIQYRGENSRDDHCSRMDLAAGPRHGTVIIIAGSSTTGCCRRTSRALGGRRTTTRARNVSPSAGIPTIRLCRRAVTDALEGFNVDTSVQTTIIIFPALVVA